METKYAYLGLGLAFVGGAALGTGAGYRWAMKKFYRSYEEVLAAEIKETQEFYANLYKKDFPTAEDAAAALIPDTQLEEATDALRKYAGMSVRPQDLVVEEDLGKTVYDAAQNAAKESVEVEVEHRNVFEDGLRVAFDWADRDETKPYIVGFDEYMEHPEGHDEIQLTYYAGDSILGDDQDEPVENVEDLVGRENLKWFGLSDPDDPHILLIRNIPKNLDIEITLSDGKFAHEVAGFTHSDEPMRRPRRNWDDD